LRFTIVGMHEGVCPSCQGTEIYAARDGVDIGEFGAVGLRPNLDLNFRGAVALHQTHHLWAYLCSACGLVEFRLHDPTAVEFVKQHWVRVTAKS
jgi:hypothetical protein